MRSIYEIEDRLREAKKTAIEAKLLGPDRYLAFAEDRHARVLLLDGERGTGKTSLMLTLVKRWHHFAAEKGAENSIKIAYRERVSNLDDSVIRNWRIGGSPEPKDIKTRLTEGTIREVRVLDILDFDPLPIGMPLIAAIVQAWRPLVAEYDNLDRDVDNRDDGPLMDFWQKLLRVAAVGWSEISTGKGLIEQVLDREEQVQDWQNLDKDWRLFVNKLIHPWSNT